MKIKLICGLMAVLTAIMVASCYASPGYKFIKMPEGLKESGYGKVIPDSIADIIITSRNVTCKLLVRNPEAGERKDSVAKVPKKLLPTIKFLFLNPQNFQTDMTVYSPFSIWAEYEFKTRKGKKVAIEFDFGTKRWRLVNGKGLQICKGDMNDTNGLLLNFTQLLFPEDETLLILNDNLKAFDK